MIVAIVLAAGRSERMGRPKALLPAGDTTFLGAILDTLAASRVEDVRIVLGYGSERILEALSLPAEIFTVNIDYDSGMLSSVRAGIRALPSDASGFLLWPVDHPLVRASTLDRMIGAYEERAAPIVVPVHGGKRGHPVLFAARLASELLGASDGVGARAVVHAHETVILEVETDDEGVVTDIDTPGAYEKVFGRLPD